MGREIERKFLVTSDSWRAGASGVVFRQGYLSTHKERTVRVRREGAVAKITVKGLTEGAARAEFEYPIPVADAEQMLDALCEKPIIEKTRYKILHEGLAWEVDEFEGDNQGLIVAEVELPSEAYAFKKPEWAGQDVTEDPRYFNSRLVERPFKTWGKAAAKPTARTPAKGKKGPRKAAKGKPRR